MTAPNVISCGFILALFLLWILPGVSAPKTPEAKKHQKGQPITSKEKTILLNVWQYFRGKESKLTNEQVDERVAKVTGISESSIRRTRAELKKTGKVTTPRKTLPKAKGVKKRLSNHDEFTLSAIRRKMHQFFIRNEPPTLDKLKRAIDEDETLPNIPRTTLFRLLKDLDIRYKKRGRNSMLIERDEIIQWRMRYLRDIRRYRSQGRHIFFLDETWANAGHTPNKVWQDTTIQSSKQAFLAGLSPGLKEPSGKGGRLIILHVGNENGFIEGAELVFRSGGKLADYHGEMNGATFEKWFTDTLLPKLPRNSVIVMDNAPYHSVRTEQIPTSNSRKGVMQEWLTAHSIQWALDMVKAELYELVKENKSKFLKYKVDEIAEANGHNVLRLPPYHCQLNPIEMVWAQVKNYVASHNATFKMPDVEVLVHDAFSKVTVEQWKNYVNHILKEEEEMKRLDGLVDQVVEEFIITVGGESDENDTDTTDSDEE